MDIKDRVRFFQKARKMNNNQLSKAAGLNPSVLSSLFTRSQEPEISTLKSICKGLNVTMSEFFSEGEQFDLTPDQNDLLFLYNRLPEQAKTHLMEFLKALE